MGKFDLNNPIDFARATNSFGGSILQLFTGRGQSAWILEEGAYQSGKDPAKKVVFHVFRTALPYGGALENISDSGGRRKAKFVFPYLDGQLTEDMGRKAETFSFSIILHGGEYLNAFNDLLSILNEPTPGTLIHPVRGKITCAMEDYEILHEERSRKAVAIRLTMIEHSTGGLALGARQNKSAPSKLAKLTDAFKKIESAINQVQGAVFLIQSVKNTVVQNLQAVQDAFGKLSGNMNATFNAGGNIPALLPVQTGGLQDSQGGIISNSTSIALSPADPFVNLPASLVNTQLQTALAIEQLSKDVLAVRAQISTQIGELETSGNGLGALEFFDNIIDLRTTANDLQDAFEAGKQSSQVRIIKYITPLVMSVREVCFANGLSPDDGIQVAFLNPELDSLNQIAKGTQLRVAIS